MDKIIINRSDAIGDLILTLPMTSWIKKRLPQTKIALIVRTGNRFIGELCPFVDEVYEVSQIKNPLSSLLSFKKIFSEFRPDVFVHVGGNKWASFAAAIFGIKSRLGLKNKLLPYLFLNKGTSQSRSLALMHEAEYNINLLDPILPDFRDSDLPELVSDLFSIEDSYISEGKSYLAGLFKQTNLFDNPSNKLVFIHPGMTGHSLNWSPRNYARLAKMILDHFPNTYLVVSYTSSDEEYISTVREQLNFLEHDKQNNLIYLDGGKIGLFEYVKCLSAADAYVGGSTGPTHLAGVLGVPFLSFFSPIKTQSSYRWRPLSNGQKFKIINPDVVCGEDRFCAKQSCPYYDCMGKIEVKPVFDQFSLILGEN